MAADGALPSSFQSLTGAADHPLFAKYTSTVELQPERPCQVLYAKGVGARADDVLFFIHGAMASMSQFELQLDHFLERGHTVVAIDQLGCGTSPKPRDFGAYSFDLLFADLCELVKRHAGKRNVFIGHSYGSSMALKLAVLSAQPGSGVPRPDGLVLLGSGIGPDCAPASVWIFWLPLFLLEMLTPLLRNGFKERALHPETLKEGTDVHRRLLARMRAAEGVNPMHMVQACVQQMRWVQRSELASVTSPALLVSGESDRITKAEWAQALSEALPKGGEVHILTGASHQVMLEKPAQVNALIDAFLEKALP